jgi:N-acetylmuramoyl-L-alanine amidase
VRILIIRKKWIFTIIFIMCISLCGSIYYQKAMLTSNMVTLNKAIIIDAGHGGVDGGAVGRSGVKESKINLKIAMKLRSLLEQSGAVVILTRDDDMGLYSDSGTIRNKKNEDLRNRKKIIDTSEADLLISIHLNSFPESKYYGAQTFYPKNCEESRKAAEYIQEELIRVLDNGNTRVSKVKDDIYLLKYHRIPTVLVECGFLSNPMEENLLQVDKYQEKISWSIYIGILRYFHEYQNDEQAEENY